MTTLDKLKSPPRQARAVELPGGLAIHVRDLTLAELRRVEALADLFPDDERNIGFATILAASALCEEDGSACFGDPSTEAAQAAVTGLTLAQIEALGKAILPSKADAKND